MFGYNKEWLFLIVDNNVAFFITPHLLQLYMNTAVEITWIWDLIQNKSISDRWMECWWWDIVHVTIIVEAGYTDFVLFIKSLDIFRVREDFQEDNWILIIVLSHKSLFILLAGVTEEERHRDSPFADLLLKCLQRPELNWAEAGSKELPVISHTSTGAQGLRPASAAFQGH